VPPEVEKQFRDVLLKTYDRALREINYRPQDFRNMVLKDGAFATARHLLGGTKPSAGFATLLMHTRLDLSVEAIVLQPEWRQYFERAELERALARLDEAHYFDTHVRPDLDAPSPDEVPTTAAFTHYWTEKQNDEKQGWPLQHIASNEFVNRGVKPGDTVFCLTQHGDRLFLIARMQVDAITNTAGAEAFLGFKIDFTDRTDHCICAEAHGSPIRFDRPIPTGIVGQLQFRTQGGQVSGVSLTPTGGVQQQAVRTVRRLMPASAGLLHLLIEADTVAPPPGQSDTYAAEEWRVRLVMHFQRERDGKIVELKKGSVAHPVCECCGFDFAAAYGDWGDGIIECHHRKPLANIAEGERTTLEDLALVCANCHRVLHRGATVLTVEQLRQILREQKGDEV
jgi:hypothetical protein